MSLEPNPPAHSSCQLNPAGSEPPPIPEIQMQPDVAYPILRLHENCAVALYADHVVLGKKRRGFQVTESLLAPEGEQALLAQLRGVKRLESRDVVSVSDDYKKEICTFSLNLRQGKPVRFKLPAAQVSNVIAYFTHLTGVVYVKNDNPAIVPRSLTQQVIRALLLLVFMASGIVGLGALFVFFLEPGGISLLIAIAGLGAAIWLFIHIQRQYPATSTPKPVPKIRAPREKRMPINSPRLGWGLKICGLGYWLFMASPLTDGVFDFLLHARLGIAYQAIIALLWAPGVALIYYGYCLGQKRYEPNNRQDQRRPVVYLRPFKDDRTTSLQPKGLFAKFSGMRGGMDFTPFGNYNTDTSARLSSQQIFTNSHPVRLMRMFFGYGTDTSEETIVRFFEKHGPVIAIGQPGEGIQTPGAARMYLADEKWKESVLEEMLRAHAVVLQPGLSEGVRWELHHIVTRLNPRRVLLCLVGFWGNPQAYEDFLALLHATTGLRLPRVVPYLPNASFVYFESGWHPHLQELCYRCPTLWPVLGNAADLRYSLGAFMHGLDNEHATVNPPLEPRWKAGWKKSASVASGFFVALFTLLVPFYAVKIGYEAIHTGPEDAAGFFERGLAAHNAEDFATARKFYEQAVQWNHSAAQNNLGLLWQNGLGGPQDFTRAMELYRLAADQGQAIAQRLLGDIYAKGLGVEKDFNQAVAFYRKAADQNDLTAQFNLAQLLYTRNDTPADREQAFEFFHKAATAGMPEAQNNLASYFYYPADAPKHDPFKARELYRAAAGKNFPIAQRALAYMCYYGEGGDRDLPQAMKLLLLLSGKDGAADNLLGIIHENGESVPINLQLAIEHYEKAARLGDEHAPQNLARLRKPQPGG